MGTSHSKASFRQALPVIELYFSPEYTLPKVPSPKKAFTARLLSDAKDWRRCSRVVSMSSADNKAVANCLALCCTVAESHRCSGPWQHELRAIPQSGKAAELFRSTPPKTAQHNLHGVVLRCARRSPLVLALGALDSTLALLRFEQLFAPLAEAILPASLHDGIALRSESGSSEGAEYLHRSERNHRCRRIPQAPKQCSSFIQSH